MRISGAPKHLLTKNLFANGSVLLALGLITMTGCAVHTPQVPLATAPPAPDAPPGEITGEVEEPLLAESPPPPLQDEIIPPRPFAGGVWIPGSWHWDGYTWLWVSGRWDNAPLGYTWIGPTYTTYAWGCAYVPGYWGVPGGGFYAGRRGYRRGRGRNRGRPPAVATTSSSPRRRGQRAGRSMGRSQTPSGRQPTMRGRRPSAPSRAKAKNFRPRQDGAVRGATRRWVYRGRRPASATRLGRPAHRLSGQAKPRSGWDARPAATNRVRGAKRNNTRSWRGGSRGWWGKNRQVRSNGRAPSRASRPTRSFRSAPKVKSGRTFSAPKTYRAPRVVKSSGNSRRSYSAPKRSTVRSSKGGMGRGSFKRRR